jgi:glyoxylase-like metal-dependent hydrolase (beta-lactamase superfamily II)
MLDIRRVKENDIIELLGYKFKIIETPGHTLGSICYLMDDKILFSGDTLFNGSIGRTDFPNGDYNKMVKSLNKLKNLPGYIIVYPGHGEATTIEEEISYNPYMND